MNEQVQPTPAGAPDGPIDAAALTALNEQVARDLAWLNYPPEPWIASPGLSEGGPYHVVIIGAGMLGLTACFALMRQGVRDVSVLDARPRGLEGPWLTYARMHTLRSPKHLSGPAQGLPSLTFRAWYEAQWGPRAWCALDRIPRPMWMQYLQWYRTVLALPVHNDTQVQALVPHAEPDSTGANYTLRLQGPEGAREIRARKVVLATGREGIASPRLPQAFVPYLGTRVWHSSHAIDFASLRDRRVAVLGLGASALDNAAEALEAGAARVHLLGRTHAMPRLNKGKAIVYAGFTEGFPALPAALHEELLGHIAGCRIAPPRASVERVTRHPAFALRLGSVIQQVLESKAGLTLRFADGEALDVDAVILGTGFRIDVEAAPELSGFAEHIALWKDHPDLGAAQCGTEFSQFPLLGPAMEFREREPGTAPYLRHLHCFNYAAAMSHGHVSGDIPAVSEGAERLARGLVRNVFLEDIDQHRQALFDYADPELSGDELAIDTWWPPLCAGPDA